MLWRAPLLAPVIYCWKTWTSSEMKSCWTPVCENKYKPNKKVDDFRRVKILYFDWCCISYFILKYLVCHGEVPIQTIFAYKQSADARTRHYLLFARNKTVGIERSIVSGAWNIWYYIIKSYCTNIVESNYLILCNFYKKLRFSSLKQRWLSQF